MASLRMSQFYKTKTCPWYFKGKCERGDACRFAHSDEERRALPDLSRTSLCPIFVKNGACNDRSCRFAHQVDQLRATDDMYKTSLCYMYMKSRCDAGDLCRHAHGAHELRADVSCSASSEHFDHNVECLSQENYPPRRRPRRHHSSLSSQTYPPFPQVDPGFLDHQVTYSGFSPHQESHPAHCRMKGEYSLYDIRPGARYEFFPTSSGDYRAPFNTPASSYNRSNGQQVQEDISVDMEVLLSCLAHQAEHPGVYAGGDAAAAGGGWSSTTSRDSNVQGLSQGALLPPRQISATRREGSGDQHSGWGQSTLSHISSSVLGSTASNYSTRHLEAGSYEPHVSLAAGIQRPVSVGSLPLETPGVDVSKESAEMAPDLVSSMLMNDLTSSLILSSLNDVPEMATCPADPLDNFDDESECMTSLSKRSSRRVSDAMKSTSELLRAETDANSVAPSSRCVEEWQLTSAATSASVEYYGKRRSSTSSVPTLLFDSSAVPTAATTPRGPDSPQASWQDSNFLSPVRVTKPREEYGQTPIWLVGQAAAEATASPAEIWATQRVAFPSPDVTTGEAN